MAATEGGVTSDRLVAGADAGAMRFPPSAPPSLPAIKQPPYKAKLGDASDAPAAHTCEQTLTLSFFFDGTGNNLDIDLSTFEHSNVARLYRSHTKDDPDNGIYRFYLAGIGTLFKDREVNDPGGTLFGRAFGDQGQARLDWAFARFTETIQEAERRAKNPTNKICWIKVSAFGFSRGAALARAFCRDLQKLCVESADSPTGWRLRSGQYPIALTFLGLFDTVASAGAPPSANNLLQRDRHAQRALWAANPLVAGLTSALQTPELKTLAFGTPGADPAPGFADGHGTWADDVRIGSMVTRCVHMISAHEIRNSFACDSTLFESAPNHFSYPPGTREMLYPGVHSDVGGGYRPGEGGCRIEKGAQLSLIPLRAMHAEAIPHVPLVPFSSFTGVEHRDFALDPQGAQHFAHMVDLYQDYRTRVDRVAVPGATKGLGGQINAHLHLYYAWRFHRIRLEAAEKRHDPSSRNDRIDAHEQQFKTDRTAIDAELQSANAKLAAAEQAQERYRVRLQTARMAQVRFGHPLDASTVQEYESARRETEERQVEIDRIKARRLTAADDHALNASIDKYDRLLLSEARQIVKWMQDDASLHLRPHYAALIDAYRNEYERGQGLNPRADAKLIEFFDHYVHDSLADFDNDASWPSDPRIVYVGGDRKLRYAFEPSKEEASTALV